MTDPVTRLNAALEGRYRIERQLGEGGMATVYLADDLRHERRVALKVLKPELAAVVGAERFLAEIKTTANLHHPHILPLFDSGEADSFLFYVMPYVEGETLRERIDRDKQLPVREAVRIGTAVAQALQHAHDRGVIHRDIKPGNILVQDGQPVVSDFGIALAVGAAGGARLTETGLSVGTPYYMSPEQATGDQEVGPSSDTYALAAVVYELLTGEPPYMGATAQAVLGRILQGAPVSATAVRKAVPANVDGAIRKALEKLPADRFAGAQEFADALEDPAFRYGEGAVAGSGGHGTPWNRLSIAMTGVAAAAMAFGWWALARPQGALPVSRFEVTLPEGLTPNAAGGVGLSLSPDGSALIFVGNSQGTSQLWRRALDQLTPTPIPGTEVARGPRVSPDGTVVAFYRNGNLETVSLTGAPPQTLVADSVSQGGGISWSDDGWVYYTKTDRTVWRVPGSGGQPEPVTRLAQEGSSHRKGELLPDGGTLLFTLASGGQARIATFSTETGEITPLFEGVNALYASTGHIVYSSMDGVLLAAPFDLDRLEVSGPSRTLLEGLLGTGTESYFTLSSTGVLAYLPGEVGGYTDAELVWVSRTGAAEPLEDDWRFESPTDDFGWALSPDGTRVAVTGHVEGNLDIWIKELPDGPFERLTFDDALQAYPVWKPGEQTVAYVSGELLNFDVWQRHADGTGTPELIHDDVRSLLQPRWGPDGEWMVFRTTAGAGGRRAGDPDLGRDIVALRPGVDSAVVPLVVSEDFTEWGPALSPDGRWLAYSSNETGREQVFVRPFPEVDSGRDQVSVNGGSNPRWANGGGELFYFDGERRLISASFEAEPEFRVTGRVVLFTLGPEYLLGDGGADYYEVAPDDTRFLFGRLTGAQGSEAGPGRYVVVQNFLQELSRLVPSN